MEFMDVIKTRPDGRMKFPTICLCCICGGVRAFYTRELGEMSDKVFAHKVALIEHGYYLGKWEDQNVLNASLYPYRCECKCDHTFDSRQAGHCLHDVTCTKCGVTARIDSSD